ncbi:type VI secretion system lipoprotein TssJ [Cellvibrio sp. KY-GH-1]|uniref:type VI secretion system lipoprotein TssJ n=1 Tax=Cellvibrio sp. KY-GH-1 TaxID=2303332 RepID=UPI001246EAF1|nr:type VI secretion system lipoprotein TssJ [Cellvibrio sp. KY-GH-1]QEY16730.1 type VI secretion system lipoprotein TssJ [Cellvibrio sp. KY-GH-1]
MNHQKFFYKIPSLGITLRMLFVVLMTWLLVSCANSGQPKKVITLELVAAENLNPDINGRPSPVAITVYQLANASGFRKGDYMSLTENGKQLLGKDLLAMHTVNLRPGQRLVLEYPITRGESALGVVVGYRVIDYSGWQLVYEYPRQGSGFWSRFGGKEVLAHRVLVEKNRIQFDSSSKEH